MFELINYTFFQHALLGSLLASIACGIIGTYIVTRRLVFISGGITHASFGGIGIGLYTGISPILAAAIFSVCSAFGVEWLSKRKDMREDSAIAVFWTFGMAVGIIFSFLSPGFTPDLSAYLFGNILTITTSDIAIFATYSLLLLLFTTTLYRPLLYTAFDPDFARIIGIKTQLINTTMMLFIAIGVVLSIRLIGIMLLLSVLTLPQIIAELFTTRLHSMMILSGIISLICCTLGLIISTFYAVPAGACIVIVLAIGYLIARLLHLMLAKKAMNRQ